jgi:hypothetical protein
LPCHSIRLPLGTQFAVVSPQLEGGISHADVRCKSLGTKQRIPHNLRNRIRDDWGSSALFGKNACLADSLRSKLRLLLPLRARGSLHGTTVRYKPRFKLVLVESISLKTPPKFVKVPMQVQLSRFVEASPNFAKVRIDLARGANAGAELTIQFACRAAITASKAGFGLP